MLCVRPSDDAKFREKVLEKVKTESEFPEVLVAIENDNILGYVVVDPVGRVLKIKELFIDSCKNYLLPSSDDLEIAEYLLRAAGNYAYNRLMTTLSFESEKYSEILFPFGFKKNNNKIQLDIKVLFKKHKSCLP